MENPTYLSMLLKYGYRVFWSISHMSDEIVIASKNSLQLLFVRRAYIDKDKGPTLRLEFNRDYLHAHLFNGILAYTPELSTVWIIPMEETQLKQIMRLSNRDDLLLQPIISLEMAAGYTTKDRHQLKIETNMSKEAKKEQSMYERILRNC